MVADVKLKLKCGNIVKERQTHRWSSAHVGYKVHRQKE